jgi:NAD(P)H-nitrite reductase large subunit
LAKQKQLVIVGNGGAALAAIRAIRSVDRSSAITVISGESHYAYSPVALTYYLAGRIRRNQLFLTDEAFYRDREVELILDKKAVEIMPRCPAVRTEDGKEFFYDRLLIATGASPKLPAEYVGSGALVLRTLADADRILAAAQGAKEAIILGGGLVSLQTAQALWKRELKVSVVVGSRQILSRNLDAKAAFLVQEAMVRQGVNVCLGSSVTCLEPSRHLIHVRLDTGQALVGALVVSGKGVRPNLLQGPLCASDDMRTDEYLRTCLENVYAAGDVSLGWHLIHEQWDRVANWPNACYQGWLAGLNMAGVSTRLAGLLNHNVTELFGVRVASIGLVEPPCTDGYQVLTWENEGTRVYKKIVLRDKRLVGAILVNDIGEAGVIHNLVRKKADLSAVLAEKPAGQYNLAGLLHSQYLPN